MRGCSFCRRSSRPLVYEAPHVQSCAVCARRASTLLLEHDGWMLFGVTRPAEPTSEAFESELEHDLALLTADEPAPVSDADVHADLATAYRDMGMIPEALLEAARSICAEQREVPDEGALAVFFDGLTPDRVAALRTAMFGAS